MWELKKIKIHEDKDILVVNKPSGLIVNNSLTAKDETLQDMLIKEFGEIVGTSEFSERNGIVHRLDKDTSGVMLVAKTEEAFQAVKSQFMKRTVKKMYFAWCIGNFKEETFTINAPIKRDDRNRLKMCVDASGRAAKTEFEVIKSYNYEKQALSLVKAKPFSGRMHQIRVHLAALNHPVVGDKLYMTRKDYAKLSYISDRMLLHAFQIGFYHPSTKKWVEYEAALPLEFNLE